MDQQIIKAMLTLHKQHHLGIQELALKLGVNNNTVMKILKEGYKDVVEESRIKIPCRQRGLTVCSEFRCCNHDECSIFRQPTGNWWKLLHGTKVEDTELGDPCGWFKRESQIIFG